VLIVSFQIEVFSPLKFLEVKVKFKRYYVAEPKAIVWETGRIRPREVAFQEEKETGSHVLDYVEWYPEADTQHTLEWRATESS
jgi:hypothetical protein